MFCDHVGDIACLWTLFGAPWRNFLSCFLLTWSSLGFADDLGRQSYPKVGGRQMWLMRSRLNVLITHFPLQSDMTEHCFGISGGTFAGAHLAFLGGSWGLPSSFHRSPKCVSWMSFQAYFPHCAVQSFHVPRGFVCLLWRKKVGNLNPRGTIGG